MNRDETTFQTIISNHLKDTENIVWTKIKIQVAKDLQQGTPETASKINATKVVSDHYSAIQKNMDMQLHSQVHTLKHLNELSQKTETVHENPFQGTFHYKYNSWVDGSSRTDTRTNSQLTPQNTTITLLNGTEIKALDLKPLEVPSSPNSHGSKTFQMVSYSNQEVMGGAAECITSKITVKTPDGETKTVINNCNWQNLQTQLIESHNTMKDNALEYVKGVHTLYTSNDINTTDIIDPYILASQLNTLHNQTGYYGYAASELALLGIETTLHDRFQIKIHTSPNHQENQTITGMLFTNHDFNQTKTIHTNTTYNTTEWPSTSMLYIVNSEGIQHLKDTEFTVTKITDSNGEEITEATFKSYSQQEINPENLIEDLQEIQALYSELIDVKQSSVLIPTSGTNIWIAIAIALLIILIIRR
ncbi:hypothetical protein [Methanonatronarchaeum sp. AMET6-2]|uniref:hypothetical protein n=1 Tax=Methanonatronarchaeum sp. AMET6-2 TaxID=2933293 RepID=UPI0012123672|nr:hypothetical protein [Methanonatronarchaeum sp. AMET6-2]RZN60857.1 MAG: hypothetical protein EF811_06070 [Methanonatronarchaeia archaeon]UOY09555.1 hypothetical protein MU439_04695 [Methanonatronarchaeum sp. AMET6-2]